MTNLERSIQYYTEALGMKLLRTRENPEYKYTLAFLGYGPEEDNCVFELTYNWCGPLVASLASPLQHCSSTPKPVVP